MPRRIATVPLSLLALALTAACSASEDTCVDERKLATNGVGLNKLATNRLAANGLLGGAVAELALTSTALRDSLAPDVLADAFAVDVLDYTVSCALGPDQHVEVEFAGETRTFAGSLSLAPQWGEHGGRCDDGCRGWVSACLVARSNFLGESRPISLLGSHAGLEPTAEESDSFDLEEATYYGDLFGAPATLYACVPDGADVPERTCGGDRDGCAIEIVGPCSAVCDANGCRDPEGKLHAQTITVNLGSNAACG